MAESVEEIETRLHAINPSYLMRQLAIAINDAEYKAGHATGERNRFNARVRLVELQSIVVTAEKL